MTLNKEFETLLLSQNNGILTITVNRPKALNALNETVLRELKEVFTSLQTDLSYQVRGVILTGSGEKAFIAGADIKAMSTMTPEESGVFGALGQQATSTIEAAPVPVIAAVNGFALGGGCEMAMACDMIYATDSAVFGQPEINLGLVPAFGGTQRLGRYVGVALAKELCMTGRNMKADEAKERGLVLHLFENADAMMTAANKTLGKAAKKSPIVVGKCKELVHMSHEVTMEQGLAMERGKFKECFALEDSKEGISAFIEKREAKFQGQ